MTVEGNRFGMSVALSHSGRRLVLGGKRVHALVFDGSRWQHVKRIAEVTCPDSGLAMAGDGSTLAIGDRCGLSSGLGVGIEAPPTVGGIRTGTAQLYRFVSGAWHPEQAVTGSTSGQGDGFARSLALSRSGDRLVAGAPYEDNAHGGLMPVDSNAGHNSGALYIY